MVDRYNCEYCNIIGENDMCEAKDGEWVKYDDIKRLLQNTSSNNDYAKSKSCANCSKLYQCTDVRKHPEWHCEKHDFA